MFFSSNGSAPSAEALQTGVRGPAMLSLQVLTLASSGMYCGTGLAGSSRKKPALTNFDVDSRFGAAAHHASSVRALYLQNFLHVHCKISLNPTDVSSTERTRRLSAISCSQLLRSSIFESVFRSLESLASHARCASGSLFLSRSSDRARSGFSQVSWPSQAREYFCRRYTSLSSPLTLGWKRMSALSVSLINISGVPGLLLIGWLTDRLPFKLVLATSALVASLSVFLLFGFSTTLPILCLFSIIFSFSGLGMGALYTRFVSICVAGDDNPSLLSTILGLFYLIRGAFNAASGPIAIALLSSGFKTAKSGYGVANYVRRFGPSFRSRSADTFQGPAHGICWRCSCSGGCHRTVLEGVTWSLSHEIILPVPLAINIAVTGTGAEEQCSEIKQFEVQVTSLLST